MSIPLARPPVPDDLIEDIRRVLGSKRFLSGPETQSFEQELAAHGGVKHAVACSSGTAALWLAMRGLGLKPGAEVLVPAHTAFPTVEAILFAGGVPVFCDVDETFTIDPADAKRKRTNKTVGIVAVHLYGHPADLDALPREGLWLIEDCAQAHGAKYKGKRVGSMGDAGAFSFFPSKNLTVLGDGGAVLTGREDVAGTSRRLRDHGRDTKYEHREVGFNLRLSELACAIGRRLLRRLDDMNAKRRTLADAYRKALAGAKVKVPVERSYAEAVYHLFVIRTDKRDALAAHLKEKGIETGLHYPVANHRQPAVVNAMGKQADLPNTDRLVNEILSLPLYPDLDWRAVGEVAAAVREFAG